MTHYQITSALENLEREGRIRTYFERVSPAGTVSWVVHVYHDEPRLCAVLKLNRNSAVAFLAALASVGVSQKD